MTRASYGGSFARAIAWSIACTFGICMAAPVADAAAATHANGDDLHLVPRPRAVRVRDGCALAATAALAAVDASHAGEGAHALLVERWRALGIAPTAASVGVAITVTPAPSAEREAYRLRIDAHGIVIDAADDEGAFDAFATLAQLPRRDAAGAWTLPCVAIDDAPALRWRILSDDVSRGPLPSTAYFEERIRTIAGFKMNGYSPYMEHVFSDARHPLPSPAGGISASELSHLAAYAARFHVAFVPEQQTFAHMHETLRYERYAPLAETPHGYLLSPANPAGDRYATDLIEDELAAVPHPPFFHVGSDEPSDLGRGASKALVAAEGDGPVYARHVVAMANFVIAHGGGRPMIWDDALAKHPELFAALPKSLVFVNWHYGSEKTYVPYIARIARGGFDQMVAPGALNWNELYPDLDAALGNIDRFVTEGKAAHVLGLFQTVWHDDGETLFEATWMPVAFAAASAWEHGSVDRSRFARDFPVAFFGRDDPRDAADLADLARCRLLLRGNPREYGDYLFWTDPFASDLTGLGKTLDVSGIRLAAEDAMDHARVASPPPLHADAAAVIALAARRYDALGRNVQIASEARASWATARQNARTKTGYVYRGLYVAKYLLWEQRDTMLGLLPAVRATWEYENRPGHEESVLERYRVAADLAIVRADRLRDVTYRDYVEKKTIPSFDDAIDLPK